MALSPHFPVSLTIISVCIILFLVSFSSVLCVGIVRRCLRM